MNEAITYITGGESHGPAMSVIVKGLPAGFILDIDKIDHQLYRRQQGYGRGGRMSIESDKVKVLSGLRGSMTLASPLTLIVENKDHANWTKIMDPVAEPADASEKVRVPRPGHADYAGMQKYGFDDIRNVLERASARETAVRMLPGAVCRQFLEALGIRIYSHVIQIGRVRTNDMMPTEGMLKDADASDVRCIDKQAAAAMRSEIDAAKEEGDSIGGVLQVCVYGLPAGLGSYVHWDEKLSSRIAAEIMGIQAIKGIEFGAGFGGAMLSGSQYHDAFRLSGRQVERSSNHAGGLEGGVSNGEAMVFNAVMKPIPTLIKRLDSFDINTMEKMPAHKERTDTCALPAAAVVAENVTARPLLNAVLARYGADRWDVIRQRVMDL